MRRRRSWCAFAALATVVAAGGCGGDSGIETFDAGHDTGVGGTTGSGGSSGGVNRKCDFQTQGVLLKNCNPHLTDDCETDVLSDVDHCGDCDKACRRPPPLSDGRGGLISTAWCNKGQCAIACAPDYADCNGDVDDGCEVNVATDPAHCGGCGADNACGGDGAHAKAACREGMCTLSCDDDHADCDLEAGNGCEVDLATDPANCGECNYACSRAGGTPSCAFGICAITCAAGRADCNVDATDGCETDLTTDRMNCGTCRMSCGAGNCAAATCGP